jgi:hypothetical protein
MSSDRADIEQLLVKEATGIDQRDWKLFRSCWRPALGRAPWRGFRTQA